MVILWITVFFSVLVLVMFKVTQIPAKLYEYPFLIAITFVVFAAPQVVSLVRNPGGVSTSAIESVMLMSTLCMLAALIGYSYKPSRLRFPKLSRAVDEQRLLQVGVVYLAMAWFFGTMISGMTAEETGGSTWTGRVTIYHFFTNVIFIALAILFRGALRTNSIFIWCLFAIAVLQPVQAAIFAGRREATAHALVAIGMVLFFEKRIAPSRILFGFLVFFAMLIIPATGHYRSIAADRDWSRLENLDLIENFNDFLNQESILELRNAAVIIDATKNSGAYGWGVLYWDEIIWRFVPAQIVGRDVKNFLMIERDDKEIAAARIDSNYTISSGSTVTGMGDSFTQFGYFGALFFLVVGWLFRSLWIECKQGNVITQLLYIGIFTSAMRAVTHQTVDFLPGLIYQGVFMAIAYFYARKPFNQGSERHASNASPRQVNRVLKCDMGNRLFTNSRCIN